MRTFDTSKLAFVNSEPIEFGSGMNVFIGSNGVGKTTLLDNIRREIYFDKNAERNRTVGGYTQAILDKVNNVMGFSSTSWGSGESYVHRIISIVLDPVHNYQCIVLDDFAHCLGPRESRAFSNLIQELCSKYNRQVICATHTPGVLDGLDLADGTNRLFALDLSAHGRRICTRILPNVELTTLNNEYPLSRLWPMGNLGGVPNI